MDTNLIAGSFVGSAREARERNSFFVHHGPWAFGVRLFRQLQFGAKASLITLAFLVPLVLLSLAYYRTSQATIDFARDELLGVEAMQALEPWLIEAQKQRREVLSGMSRQVSLEAIDRAAANFRRVNDGLPDRIDLKGGLAAVEEARSALIRGGLDAGTPDLEARLQAVVMALIELRGSVLDASGLTLDPDQDTYYLMTLSGAVTSEVIEAVSRSRAISGVLKDAAPAAEVRRLYGFWFLGAERVDDIERAVQHAGQLNPRVRARLDASGAVLAAKTFFTSASASWFGAEFRGDVQALNPAGQAAVDELRALSARSTALLRELLERRAEATQQARRIVAAIGVGSLLVAAYLFYAFYMVMRGGLREVGRHLAAMTDGDLTTRPSPWGRDEAAQLMLLLGTMQDSLRAMVMKVRESSQGIVAASGEIAAASADLSSRTEQAAANLEESASAMEQIGVTVRATSVSTEEANRLAAENAALATRGGAVMEEVSSTMTAIHDAAHRIGDITAVIDGIAFQTNILALNAAVEAARAGEQGRGFAVVASEVRALAGRSAEAAREIKRLIGTSSETVERGATVVQGARDAIGGIVEGTGHIDRLLAQVASGAREQNEGIGHVGMAIQELDRATQQNAAMVEESAAAAASLRDQAQRLAAEVDRFRLP